MAEELLAIARRLQAISQAGLHYAQDPYDRERYEECRTLGARLLAKATGETSEQLSPRFFQEAGHPTPKIDVRGVVLREGRFLMVREKIDGLWTLPGGWAEVGLSPADNAVKEVFEESGFEVRPVRLLAVLDRMRHSHPPAFFHLYKVFIQCEIIGGEPTTSIETTEIGFFAPEALPPLSQNRVTEAQLRRLYALIRDPLAPPVFD